MMIMFEHGMRWGITFGVLFSILLMLAPEGWGQEGTTGSPAFIDGTSPERPRSDDEPVLFLHRLESKTMNVTIEGPGHDAGTFSVSAAVDYMGHEDDGWYVDFKDGTIALADGEAAKYLVMVQGPRTGHPNDMIRVCLELRDPGVNDTVIASSCFRAILIVNGCGLRMYIAENVRVTQASVPAGFDVTIKNDHDMEKDVTVIIMDRPTGWEVNLSEETLIAMQPHEARSLKLTVTPPSSAHGDEVGSVTLRAFPTGEPNDMDMSTAHTIVQPYTYIWLTCDEPEKDVEAGGTAEYTVTVHHDSNMNGSIIYILDLVEAPSDWNVWFERKTLSLSGMGHQTINITVMAPPGAMPGDRSVIILGGGEEYIWPTDDVTLITTVRPPQPVHRLDIVVDSPGMDIQPGSRASYLVIVTNAGNVEETVRIEPDTVPSGWSLAFLAIDESSNLTLGPGEISRFEARLSVPASAGPGQYEVTGMVMADGWEDIVAFTLSAGVATVAGIDIGTKQNHVKGAPGTSVSFDIHITNKGNVDDSVSVYVPIEWKPTGWGIMFRTDDGREEPGSIDLTLDAGGTAYVQLVIDLPEETYDANVINIIRVVARSVDGPRDEMDLTVTLGTPMLTMDGPFIEREGMRPGTEAMPNVTLRNAGDVACARVKVSMYDNGRLVGTVDVGVISPSQKVKVAFVWEPTAGDHELRFVAAPEDGPAAPVETSTVVSVRGDDSSKTIVPGPSWLIPVGMAVLLAFMAVVVLGRHLVER